MSHPRHVSILHCWTERSLRLFLKACAKLDIATTLFVFFFNLPTSRRNYCKNLVLAFAAITGEAIYLTCVVGAFVEYSPTLFSWVSVKPKKELVVILQSVNLATSLFVFFSWIKLPRH